MKFEIGDKVRLINDKYTTNGEYGSIFLKNIVLKNQSTNIGLKNQSTLDPEYQFKKNDLCTILHIFERENLVNLKKTLTPSWSMIVKIEDIERTEE